jgi:hypothetical protein
MNPSGWARNFGDRCIAGVGVLAILGLIRLVELVAEWFQP